MLTVEELLAAEDLAEEVVEVPEWGGSVRIRAFTKAQQHRMRKRALVKGEVDQSRLEMLMVVNGVVEPALTEEHVDVLMAKSAAVIDRILARIIHISGSSREAVDAAKRGFPEES